MNNELTNADNIYIKDLGEVIPTIQKNNLLVNDVEKLDLDDLGDVLSDAVEFIPYFNKAKKVIKFGHSIIEKFNIKKQFVFLFQLQNGDLDEKGLEKRNKAYQFGKKWYFDEVEQTVVFLHRTSRVEKAKIMAELYRDLINSEITTEGYREYLDMVDQIYIQDIPHLLEIYHKQSETNTLFDGKAFLETEQGKDFSFNEIRCSRLKSIGLLKQYHPMSYGFSLDSYFSLSEYGMYFCEIFRRIDNLNTEYKFKK
ncbi:MAG: hypothetical protein J6A49_05445 [Clostridia bacterium]|nr:hypothetical protein [Clostridia bacterium]